MEPNLNIRISPSVLKKLTEKHNVTAREVSQCFMNRDGKLLEDDREKHKTKPPSEWFLAETNRGRLLKVIFVQVGNDIDIKSAYEADGDSKRIYSQHGY